jgi:hypothetical protein
MAILAFRLLAPPSLARSQRELASDAQSVGRKGSSPRTLGGSPSLSLSSWHWIDDGRFRSHGAAFDSPF